VVSSDYERTALVLTIRHETEHDGLAIQHFLEGGPFASLPVTGRRSSIVWTEHSIVAANYLKSDRTVLANALEARLGGRFGSIEIEEGPESFPLIFQIARRFVAPRLALVGDAAHRVHPLAGQGLNIGLRDVATIAELILDHVRLGMDPGSEDVLREYERRRLFDATASAAAFDFMHKSYALKGPVPQLARRAGMTAVERMSSIKKVFQREAGGLLGDSPNLFR
jgi:2-octaprenyl-6-methoxyphenol hydroxylase